MFNDQARSLFKRQYAIHPDETLEQGMWRATEPLEHNEVARMLVYEAIMDKRFIPGGRIIAGAGTDHRNTINCYVLGSDTGKYDTLEEVRQLVIKVARTTKVGGGIGINFDRFATAKFASKARLQVIHYMDAEHPDAAQFIKWQYRDITLPEGFQMKQHVKRSTARHSINPDDCVGATVIKVGDDIESIFNAAFEAAKLDGPVVLDWSDLRPEGSDIKGSGGTSSGAASFAIEVDNILHWIELGGITAGPVATLRYVFNPVLRSVRQGGTRRGAGMATLSINNLDRELFLNCKDLEVEARLGSIECFNISFLVGDKDVNSPFMEQVAMHAWKSGEPGVIFVDSMNRDNPLLKHDGPILSTNPCLTGDTMILTAAGPISFADLAASGEDVLVWCVDKDSNEPKLSKMVRPHKTASGAEVLKITFDSGLVVRATPEHGFFTTHRNKVMAKDLKPGQSVSAFAIHQHRDGQLRILRNRKQDNTVGQWYVHRIFAEHYGFDLTGKVVHHIDQNPLNNSQDNLQAVTQEEHNRLHYPGRLANGFYRGKPPEGYVANHKVVSVEHGGYEDVYNGMVEDFHTYIVVDPSPVGQSFVSGVLSANCGEVPLYRGEACDLGHIVLTGYVKDGKFDFELFSEDIMYYTMFLDANLDYAKFPTDDATRMAQRNRRLGLGITGLAHTLIQLGIQYGSDYSLEFISNIIHIMAEFSAQTSQVLAEELGFPEFNDYAEGIEKRRNIATLTIAPTGTTSMIVDTSSGIEPLFSIVIYRKVGGEYIKLLDPLFFDMLSKYDPPTDMGWSQDGKSGWDVDKCIESIASNHGSLKGLGWVPKQLRFLFVTTHDLEFTDHIKIQATAQVAMNHKSVGNSISKTINLRNEATAADILSAYRMAHELGCKGITVYRDGSRQLQVLNTSEDAQRLAEQYAQECANGSCEVSYE